MGSPNLRPGREVEYVLKPGVCETWEVNGGVVMGIHYGADPEKDEAWALRMSEGVPPSVWQREMEGRIRVFEGTPVHPEYNSGIHEVDDLQMPPMNRVGTLIGSWDCGNTLTPAFVLRHVTPRPFQIQVLKEVVCPEGEAMFMAAFAPYVRAEMDAWDVNWKNYTIEHWADPSAAARLGGDGRSAIDVAQEYGFNLIQSSNNPEERLGAVSWALMDMIDEETPRVVYSATGCPMLTKGLAGGYQVGTIRVGDGSRVLNKPIKNKFSHPCDADQYGAIRAKQVVLGQASHKPLDRMFGDKRRPVPQQGRYV